jgi:hypothetical protein
MMNGVTISLAAAAFLALSAGASWAQSDKPAEIPDATIEYSGGSVALGVGYSWGHGILHFKGADYRFTANGLSLANVGASSVKATGTVYHLAKIEDFPGNYTGIGAGATIAGGGAVAAMRNQNGVVIHVASTTRGLQFTLAASGVAITLEAPPSSPPATGSTTAPR